MAVAPIRNHTAGTSASSGTTVDATVVTANVTAGNTLFAWVSFDNLTTTTPTVSGISVPAGETNTWALIPGAFHDSSRSGGGSDVRGELWGIVTTMAWTIGTTVTATFSAAITAKTILLSEFSGVTLTVRGTAGSGTSTSFSPSASTSGTALVAGDLIFGGASFEGESTNGGSVTGDSDTLNGSWSAAYSIANGGNAAAKVTGITQYKIITATGAQTYNPTQSGTAADSGAAIVALVPTAPGPISVSGTFTGEGTLSGTVLVRPGTPTLVRTNIGTNPRAISGNGGWVTNDAPTWAAAFVTSGFPVHPLGITTAVQGHVLATASNIVALALDQVDNLATSGPARRVGVWVCSMEPGYQVLSLGGYPVTPLFAGVWTFVKTTTTIGAGVKSRIVVSKVTGNAVSTDLVYATGCVTEAGDTVGDYFDGSTPSAGQLTYAWTGAVNASTSTESTAPTVTFTGEGTLSGTVLARHRISGTFTGEGTLSGVPHGTGAGVRVTRVTRAETPLLLARVVSPLGQWVYLDAAGRTSGLSYVWTYPGGPTSAEISLGTPASAQIPALTAGATFTVHRGTGIVWTGRVATIERGTPWKIQADGLAGLSTKEPVTASGSLDAIVDARITAGLPWTRPATLGGSFTLDPNSATMLDEALATGLNAIGKRWTLDTLGAIRSIADPTVPTLIVRADTAPPTTLNDYATEVVARYNTGSGTASVRVQNTAAAAKFGRVTKTVDLGYSTYTSTDATAAAQQYLNRVSPRMTVAGAFTVNPGQIVTASGAPVDLPGVTPGQMVRLQLVSLIRDAMLIPTLAIDMVIGQTEYNGDDNTLTLTPVDVGPSPAQIMFGKRGGGDWVAPS